MHEYKKMILIDALYVNMGGGLVLLKYLIETMEKRQEKFFLLADARCTGMFDNVSQLCYLNASLRERKRFYKGQKNKFSSVFCFGNVPPPIRLNVPVYTYFHNINMLTLADCRSKKQKIKFLLKRTYIKSIKRNTDEWFVQTSNTAGELIKHLNINSSQVKLYPFYKVPCLNGQNNEQERTDYIFVGDDSGSKGHKELVSAWKLLHERGVDRVLHLTISEKSKLLSCIEDLVKSGVRIENHGFMQPEGLFHLYCRCKATVYPSKNESFGLGLVEAMECGCDVIGSNLSFVHAICKPSEVFDHNSSVSIAEAIIRYENGSSVKTEQIVKNMVVEMTNHIT